MDVAHVAAALRSGLEFQYILFLGEARSKRIFSTDGFFK